VNDDKMMKNLFEDVHREDSKKVDWGKCGRVMMRI
jgi:hypothetical protein